MSDEEIYRRLTARWLLTHAEVEGIGEYGFVEGCACVALIELELEMDHVFGGLGLDHGDYAVSAYIHRYKKFGGGILIPNTKVKSLLEI